MQFNVIYWISSLHGEGCCCFFPYESSAISTYYNYNALPTFITMQNVASVILYMPIAIPQVQVHQFFYIVFSENEIKLIGLYLQAYFQIIFSKNYVHFFLGITLYLYACILYLKVYYIYFIVFTSTKKEKYNRYAAFTWLSLWLKRRHD